jgi:RecB family endonuclease NucS
MEELGCDRSQTVPHSATEYETGKAHRGRIDSLGLDENGSPVIFEYKRTSNEDVINQGLFYLDWLMNHKGM